MLSNTSFEESLQFPCLEIDANRPCDVDEDSVVTFCSSVMGESSKIVMEDDRTSQKKNFQWGYSSAGAPTKRMPRRRDSLLRGVKKPQRRSTKSSSSDAIEAQTEDKYWPSNDCLISLLQADQQLPRIASLERFQEEPQPRNSLRLPAKPQRLEGMPQPQRRSTKSSSESCAIDADFFEEQQCWGASDTCLVSLLYSDQPLLQRKESMERFQEEPKSRASLGLPDKPRRKASLASITDEEDDDVDIAAIIASLSPGN